MSVVLTNKYSNVFVPRNIYSLFAIHILQHRHQMLGGLNHLAKNPRETSDKLFAHMTIGIQTHKRVLQHCGKMCLF